jgi:hypothetical protein
VAIRSAGHVSNYDHSILQEPEADYSSLPVFFAGVLYFESNSGKHNLRVLEVQTTVSEGLFTLGRIEGNCNWLL